MATAIHPKTEFPVNTPRGGPGLLGWLRRVSATVVGGKQVVAVTGLLLSGFVVVHLVGNLKIYAGQDSINAYAEFLKGLGPLLWAGRVGLLAVFVAHVALGVKLKNRSRKARPVAYAYRDTVQASYGSRTMLLTGLLVGAFALFHVAHYTLGVVKGAEVAGIPGTVNYLDLRDAEGRHDVYSMAVYGFRNPYVTATYVLAMLALFVHLRHGVGSAAQTLGLNTPRWQRFWTPASWAVALFVVAGNVAIPVSILAGGIEPAPDLANTLQAMER